MATEPRLTTAPASAVLRVPLAAFSMALTLDTIAGADAPESKRFWICCSIATAFGERVELVVRFAGG
jgi:hypothetical protein